MIIKMMKLTWKKGRVSRVRMTVERMTQNMENMAIIFAANEDVGFSNKSQT